MPGHDRMGPQSKGPMTGRRLGLCARQQSEISESTLNQRRFVRRFRRGGPCSGGGRWQNGVRNRGFGWRMIAEEFSRGGDA